MKNQQMDIFFDDDQRRRIRRRRKVKEKRTNRPWTRLKQHIYTLGNWFRRCRRYFVIRRVGQSERQRQAERIQDFYRRVVGLVKLLSILGWYMMALIFVYLIFSDILPAPITIISCIRFVCNFFIEIGSWT